MGHRCTRMKSKTDQVLRLHLCHIRAPSVATYPTFLSSLYSLCALCVLCGSFPSSPHRYDRPPGVDARAFDAVGEVGGHLGFEGVEAGLLALVADPIDDLDAKGLAVQVSREA